MNYGNAYNNFNSLFFKDILNRVYLKGAAGPIGPTLRLINFFIFGLSRGSFMEVFQDNRDQVI